MADSLLPSRALRASHLRTCQRPAPRGHVFEHFGLSPEGMPGFRNHVSGPRREPQREPGGALFSQGARGRKERENSNSISGGLATPENKPRARAPGATQGGIWRRCRVTPERVHPGPGALGLPRPLWTHSCGCGRPDSGCRNMLPLRAARHQPIYLIFFFNFFFKLSLVSLVHNFPPPFSFQCFSHCILLCACPQHSLKCIWRKN